MSRATDDVIPGLNWRREARRSAPTRLAPSIINPPGASVRERHAASKQINRRGGNFRESLHPGDDGQQRRRKSSVRGPESHDEREDEDYSPRAPSGPGLHFGRVGTGYVTPDLKLPIQQHTDLTLLLKRSSRRR
jgi:hypothetical protein